MLLRRGPGGGEADDGVSGVVGLPDVESDFLTKPFHVSVLQNHKLLVGRGFEEEGDAFCLEDRDHVLCPVDGVLRNAAVQPVGKEGVELDAEEAAFGQESAVLLDRREKVLRGLLRENDSLAAQGADFGSADVEDVTEVLQVRQRIIASRACQGISQAGSVDEKR